MKRFAWFLPIMFLFSCNQNKQQSYAGISADAVKEAVKSDDTLASIIKKNINKQPAIDTVFLGFTFGMTKQQTIGHFNQLVKAKKLFYNDKDQRYEYSMALGVTRANASIAPDFMGGKLYKLTLAIAPVDDMTTDDMVYQQVAIMYMKKYQNFTLFRQSDLLNPDEKEYHWIKNNLHIFQHKTVDGNIVSYINTPVEQSSEKKEKNNTDSAKTQTQKDI
ncbi:MAG TPA: hypothetical protein VHE59_18220 [Mucilaginibacter sp.]|nr:hypothetical protein [Mucilaginibacter sp.]